MLFRSCRATPQQPCTPKTPAAGLCISPWPHALPATFLVSVTCAHLYRHTGSAQASPQPLSYVSPVSSLPTFNYTNPIHDPNQSPPTSVLHQLLLRLQQKTNTQVPRQKSDNHKPTLVIQWLRGCPAMEGIWSTPWWGNSKPTCYGATKPEPRLLGPHATTTESICCSKGST